MVLKTTCLSVKKYASERVLAFIGTIHIFSPLCRWTLQTTQYLCEHIVEWTCKDIFFGLYNLAQIVFSVSTTNSESSSSEIIPSIREAPFCTWDILMTLFLYRALHLSQITLSYCISLMISFETYFCNGLTFIGRLLFRCDLPQTAHWYAFGISENTYGHLHITHQINPCMWLTWYIHN